MGARAVAAVTSVVMVLGGYLTADLYDRVPGIISATPLPKPEPLIELPALQQQPAVWQGIGPVNTAGAMPTTLGLTTALGASARDPRLGPAPGLTIIDAATQTVVLNNGGDQPRVPASVAKILTAAAALSALGPDATLPTIVKKSADGASLTLVAGGDVLLEKGMGKPGSVVGRAGLEDLAIATANALKQQSAATTPVTLHFDTSLFEGTDMGPGWSPADVTAGFVSVVTPMAINAGRLGSQPYPPRDGDPNGSVATAFAKALQAQGIRLVGAPTAAPAPPDAQVIAQVRSAPIVELVGYMLEASENNVAEALGRVVARAHNKPATFAGAGQAILGVLAAEGVPTQDLTLVDASGLGTGSKISPRVLAAILAQAARADRPLWSGLLTGLPIAGASGTLKERFSGQPQALGLVHAKTGTLTSVTSLAGFVVGAEGRLLAFAVMGEEVANTVAARQATDAVVARLLTCGCH